MWARLHPAHRCADASCIIHVGIDVVLYAGLVVVLDAK
jgi:hypothetical protein